MTSINRLIIRIMRKNSKLNAKCDQQRESQQRHNTNLFTVHVYGIKTLVSVSKSSSLTNASEAKETAYGLNRSETISRLGPHMSRSVRKPLNCTCENQRRRSAALRRRLISAFDFGCIDSIHVFYLVS